MLTSKNKSNSQAFMTSEKKTDMYISNTVNAKTV